MLSDYVSFNLPSACSKSLEEHPLFRWLVLTPCLEGVRTLSVLL